MGEVTGCGNQSVGEVWGCENVLGRYGKGC